MLDAGPGLDAPDRRRPRRPPAAAARDDQLRLGELRAAGDLGVLLVSGDARVWELFVLQALGGAATAFYSPASTGLVPETVKTSMLQQANAYVWIYTGRHLSYGNSNRSKLAL